MILQQLELVAWPYQELVLEWGIRLVSMCGFLKFGITFFVEIHILRKTVHQKISIEMKYHHSEWELKKIKCPFEWKIKEILTFSLTNDNLKDEALPSYSGISNVLF